MADEYSIQRKELLPRLKHIDIDEWVKAANVLGLLVTQPKGGSSHYAIRVPNKPQSSPLTVVYRKMNKIPSVNQKVFKRFLKNGIDEDALWKALGLL